MADKTQEDQAPVLMFSGKPPLEEASQNGVGGLH